MSGVAEMLHRRGFQVHGTDSSDGPEVRRLRELGINVTIGHTGDAVRKGDALVLTDAIDLSVSPEVRAALESGAPLFRRSQVLGWLMRGKKVIAVTGTHGKTTTTGLVGTALMAAGIDPTVVVGAFVPGLGNAVIEGSGEWAVIEACEAYDSLRDFDPQHVILTNFEPDHLDFHGSWENLKAAMLAFVHRMPIDGKLIFCRDDAGAVEVADAFAGQKQAYGKDDELLTGLALPGLHNRLNAQAARIVCAELGVDAAKAETALKAFTGASRRLQVLLDDRVAVVDDYAHHPKEITASIQALREKFPNRRLVVVFQPHLYSRTADFLKEFAQSLSQADYLVMTDIYPAREAPMPGISSARIAEQVTCPVDYVPSRHLLPRHVKSIAQDGDVIVGMGAGTIATFGPDFVAEFQRNGKPKVVVLMGGDSAEREVSLHTGRAIYAALKSSGHDVSLVDVSEKLLSGQPIDFLSGVQKPDVAFLAVHGTNAEDGAIQGLLNLLHIPYTGSGILASAIAMDKERTKLVLKQGGLPVPEGILVKSGEEFDSKAVPGEKWVVKPNAQGSTVGLSFVNDRASLDSAVEKARHYGADVLVEEWIEGTEVSVPVLVDRALPVVEIVPSSGVYDFEMKYSPGATLEICPARLSDEITAKCQELALRAHQILGCRGASRTDILIKDGREPVILEVNTLPGMTPTSLLPKSAEAAGLTFAELCEEILADAQKARA